MVMKNKNIQIKFWEVAQRLIALAFEGSLQVGFDDTSDMYEHLLETVEPDQIDNFHGIVCRKDDGDPIRVGDLYLRESDGNVFRCELIDIEYDEMEFRVNGANAYKICDLEDGSNFVMLELKLLDKKDYYKLLDTIWLEKKLIFTDDDRTRRVDFLEENDQNLTNK